MDQFVSAFTNKIDTKGRVSVPASFRTVLAKDGLDGIYCYPSLDAPALDAGGQRLVDKINALVEDLAPYSDEKDQLATALFGTSEILSIDQDGRTMVPERFASMPASPRTSLSSAWVRNFRCGSRSVSKHISRRRVRKCAISASYSARGAAEAAGQREHGNDGGSRQEFACRRRTGPPHSRDALRGAGLA